MTETKDAAREAAWDKYIVVGKPKPLESTAFGVGFDAGYAARDPLVEAVRRYISGHSDKMCRRPECPTWAELEAALEEKDGKQM